MSLNMSRSLFIAFQTFSLMIICGLSFITAASNPTLGNWTDQLSLLAFKNKINNDPLGVTTSWNETIHFCQWRGVTCSLQHQRVTALDLSSQKLEGSISPHIGNLSFLKVLDLENNSFSQEIPQEISKLFRLQVLTLMNNSFEGRIPVNLSHCSRLVSLHLNGNKLEGEIPKELGSLGHLQELALYKNNLVGRIPLSIGNLSSLQKISVSDNFLVGSVPTNLGRLTNLTFLSLGKNRLSATIPISIFHNLTSLKSFQVSVNQIQGTLPSDFGLYLSSLEVFSVFANKFTGLIPSSISNLSNLRYILMGENLLTGAVPSLTSLSDLTGMNLDENDLGNMAYDNLDFISQLVNCSSLEFLSLTDNNFGGVLPKSLSNLSISLTSIAMGRNRIHGSIPDDIGNLINLVGLGMERNQLAGSIPNSIVKLQNLQLLYFHGNQLSGTIPHSIGNLTLLTELIMGINNLQGEIPMSLRQCQQLLRFDLSYNNLTGTIPKEVLSQLPVAFYLDLSHNQLIGSIPLEVGKLLNIDYLDVSGNRLSGKIPSSLGSCTSLEGLYLADNAFQGIIPASLSSLKGLEELDLSQNNLTGKIPKYIEDFKVLVNLNLSFNDLEGEVPLKGVFTNVSAVSIIGNRRLCGGMPELQLPPCKTQHKKGMFSLKLKLVFCSVALVVGLVLAFGLVMLRRTKHSKPLPDAYIQGSMLTLSYQDILRATDGFSPTNLLGVGTFGSVYKGNLGNDLGVVAVKVLNLQQRGAPRSFMAECEAMRNIRHRNLVRIITASSTIDFQGEDFKALIYEFMINGSLAKWLHPEENADTGQTRILSLLERLNIAIDVASALDYLHNHCDRPIIHCDLKPTNILLDARMIAHVSDFGLAKFLSETTSLLFSGPETSSIGVRGSIGYVAPEYGMGSEVSIYGDVYSYGILLLEMFTGKEPTDNMFYNDLNLHNYAKMALPHGLLEIVDQSLLHTVDKESSFTIGNIEQCLISIIQLGVTCSLEQPNDRIGMNEVVRKLHSIKNDHYGNLEARRS